MPDITAAALDYARLDWRVFPVVPGAGKKPAWSSWTRSATTDTTTITTKFKPEHNVGHPLGWNGSFVLDADPKQGGNETLVELGRTIRFPAGPRARTGSGGTHVF